MITTEQVPTGSLQAHPNNVRTHSTEQTRQIARSIAEWGFTQPIVTDEEGTILIGHGRWEAAKSLGLPTVPVIIRADLSEADKRALIISDNGLAEAGSTWDEDVLKSELQWLLGAQYDVSLTAFDIPEYGAPKEEPEGKEPETVCQPGDIWMLGPHVVICSDSDPETMAIIADEQDRPDVLTGWPDKDASANKIAERLKVAQAGSAYLWHAGTSTAAGFAADNGGYQVRAQIILPIAKRMRPENGGVCRAHVTGLYCALKSAPGKWHGGRAQTTLWHDAEMESLKHGAMTRVMINRILHNHTEKGGLIWFPWATDPMPLIATHQAQRRATLFIRDMDQADTAIATWEAFTGRQAQQVGGQ